MKHDVPEELLASILTVHSRPEELIHESGLPMRLSRLLVASGLSDERAARIGLDGVETAGRFRGESYVDDTGEVLDGGTFEKMIALYSHGLNVSEIKPYLEDLCGAATSASVIETVAAAVGKDAKSWQAQPLAAAYSIVYVDCIPGVNLQGAQSGRAMYVPIGVSDQGVREVLGLWLVPSLDSSFWLALVADFRARGVKDIMVACVDGLAGGSEAFENAYPAAAIL